MAQSRPRHPRHRRLGGASVGSGDRSRQSRDRCRRHRCEPASAVTLAGLKKLVAAGKIDPAETVVLLLTGHTLKDSDYTIQYHRGDLLRDDELTTFCAEIEATRRNTVELDADVDQVLRALERVAQ